jgi:hypothetical protein
MRVLLFRAAGITILLLVAPVWATVVFASDAEVGGLSATQEVRDLPVAVGPCLSLPIVLVVVLVLDLWTLTWRIRPSWTRETC